MRGGGGFGAGGVTEEDKLDASTAKQVLRRTWRMLRNERRSARRHAAALRRLPAPRGEFDSSDEITERIDALTLGRRATRLLAELPQPEREAAALCFGYGLSYRAAAAVLDVPVGTVRSRLFRARTRLHALEPERRLNATTPLEEAQ